MNLPQKTHRRLRHVQWWLCLVQCTVCLTLLNHSVRVCLCVSQPCACLCLFLGHGDCATPSRVVLHAIYLISKGDGRRTSRTCVPPLGCATAAIPETLLSTRGLLLYRQTLLSGVDLPSHLVSGRLREDVVVRVRRSFFELCLSLPLPPFWAADTHTGTPVDPASTDAAGTHT